MDEDADTDHVIRANVRAYVTQIEILLNLLLVPQSLVFCTEQGNMINRSKTASFLKTVHINIDSL